MKSIFINRSSGAERMIYVMLLLSLTFSFVLQHDVLAQNCGCDHYILPSDVTDNNAKIINWDAGPTGRNVQPGQTICFTAGAYPYSIRIKNVNGQPNNRITIKNCGGQAVIDNKNNGTGATAYHALDITGSEYFILRGDGDPNYEYGIKVAASNGHGLSAAGYSTDFEVRNLEIANTDNSGINSKTDPNCANVDVSSFTQRNCYFHHNYLHHIGQEGFYIGYTHYPTHQVTCDGVSTTLIAHSIENLEIYDNTLEYIGWDGIQLGAMSFGGKIYSNTIREYATAGYSVHVHGIQLSDNNDGAAVYNNKILPIDGLAGEGCGIASWAENPKIYNNLLVRTGRDIEDPNDAGDKGFYAIQIYDEVGSNDGSFRVLNNTIIEPARGGVSFFNTVDARVINNIIVQAQGRYITQTSSTVNSTNFTATSTAGLGFDATYHLTNATPASIRGAGTNLYAQGVTFDFDEQARPSSGAFDIGADQFGSVQADMLIKVNFRGTTPAFSDPAWNDWNAMPTTTSPAPVFSNLKYTDGTSSNFNITVTTAFSGANGLGMTGSGAYPSEVMETNWYVHNNTPNSGVLKLSGLNNSKKYSFTFFGSREDVNGTTNRNTNYTIGSTTVTLNASNNTNNTVSINNVSPSNGEIVLSVKYGTGATFGYLNAMEILETSTTVARVDQHQTAEMATRSEQILEAFPIPFTNRLTIQCPPEISDRATVTLIDAHGRQHLITEITDIADDGRIELDLGNGQMTSGVYLLRVKGGNGVTQAIKVVRQ